MMIIGMFIILSIMSVIIRVMVIIVTITSIIMCEADRDQFMNKNFLRQVELLYEEPVSTIVNATGLAAHNTWYPNDAQCMAFSPYHKGSRDAMAETVAANVREVWNRDGCVGFHCNQTFHRGVQVSVVAFMMVYGCDPVEIMCVF